MSIAVAARPNTSHTTEQDIRLSMLNTLLTTPHRNLELIHPIHQSLITQDPLFYSHLAAWYIDTGEIRDHKEMFIISLVLSDFEGHRDVGLAFLRQLPPYQVTRVVDFIHGKKIKDVPPRVKGVKHKSAPTPAATAPITYKDFGLYRNIPRSLCTEITRYLREREASPDWFDATALKARKALKRLYALLRIKPSPRAQAILFEERPPADSRLFALKELAKATDPATQAQTILDHKIPYTVASTVIEQMSPSVIYALVQVMTPQELLNNLGSLRKRGAFDNSDIKAAIDKKLQQAKKSKRISALKTTEAIQAAGLDAATVQTLHDVADTQLKSKGRIQRSTALFVDKSGSMDKTIELGKQIGAMLSTVCTQELYVYAFDTMPYRVLGGTTLDGWEKAFKGIRSGGGTGCGAPLVAMLRERQVVEQIVLVTDEEENQPPYFFEMLAKYRKDLHVDPTVVIVRVPGSTDKLERIAVQHGVPVDVWTFTGDYYSLPGLIPLLAKNSRLDLLLDIMAYELPKRKAA